ncbi:unnamed protein product [Moneuplotes crassus]|uniref:Uncharacterized protein n=1 Tax=Euplotes crassus TaxID=5936 RepID=A0AAD1UBX3_EUPCR|nr:unnamed protein product [Moneuplotes crassus]
MLSRIFRHTQKFGLKGAVCFRTSTSSLVYTRAAHFGILEDKFKEIREKAFNRSVKSDRSENIREESKSQMSKFSLFSSSNLEQEAYNINGMTCSQVIDRLKIAQQQKTDPYLYYMILERIQDIIINEPDETSKAGILKILKELESYKPKDEERYQRKLRNMEFGESSTGSPHKAGINKSKGQYFKDSSPIAQMFDHLKDNMNGTYFKGMLRDYAKGDDNSSKKDIYDVLEIYKTVYKNIELVLHEELDRGSIDSKEILIVLKCFSIAEEGSEVLYERIFEMIYPNLSERKYNKHDLEIILNYFPQDFWSNSMTHSSKMNSFNGLIAESLNGEIDNSSNKELLSFFRAFSSSTNFPPKILNKLLNKFVSLIENSQVNQKELMGFLEIYAMMIQDNPQKSVELNSKLLFSIVSKNIEENYLSNTYDFSFQELAVLYWVYATCEIFPGSSTDAVRTLEKVLNNNMALLITKYKPLSDSDKDSGSGQELEFDENDANAIIYYYEKCQELGTWENAETIIQAIGSIKKKYDDRPDNDGKWFVF